MLHAATRILLRLRALRILSVGKIAEAKYSRDRSAMIHRPPPLKSHLTDVSELGKNKIDDARAFVNLLRSLRAAAGISQVEFIKLTGLTGIVNWENARGGRHSLPDAPTVLRIAEFFGVDPIILLRALPSRVRAESAAEVDLLMAFRSLSPADRAAFLRDMGWAPAEWRRPAPNTRSPRPDI